MKWPSMSRAWGSVPPRKPWPMRWAEHVQGAEGLADQVEQDVEGQNRAGGLGQPASLVVSLSDPEGHGYSCVHSYQNVHTNLGAQLQLDQKVAEAAAVKLQAQAERQEGSYDQPSGHLCVA